MSLGNAAQILASSIAQSQPPDSGLRTGVVVALNAGTGGTKVGVNVSGALLVLPYLSSYIPRLADNVNIIRMESSWLVLGTSGAPAMGLVDSVIVTASSGNVSTTELVLFTTAGYTYLPNRLYRGAWQGVIQGSVAASRGLQRLRKGTTNTGTQLVLGGFVEVVQISTNEAAGFSGYFVNSTGIPVNTVISLTLLQAGAAGTVFEAASAASPAGILIFDEGPIANPALTAGLPSV